MVGLCGSDLNPSRGLDALVSFTITLGDEVSATVMHAGRDLPAGTDASCFKKIMVSVD